MLNNIYEKYPLIKNEIKKKSVNYEFKNIKNKFIDLEQKLK